MMPAPTCSSFMCGGTHLTLRVLGGRSSIAFIALRCRSACFPCGMHLPSARAIMLCTHASLSMVRKTSCAVLSSTFTAAYRSALPAVCSMPGTTPNVFNGWPSATQMPQPDLRILGSAGCAAPPSVYAFTVPLTSCVEDVSTESGLPTSIICGNPLIHRC
eukprot:3451449-Heterocapsa_arctica.AAC.1